MREYQSLVSLLDQPDAILIKNFQDQITASSRS